MIKSAQILLTAIALLSAPAVCCAKQEQLIQGRTMGTTYQVKVVVENGRGIAGLKDKIERRLAQINNSMSTYLKDSEISRFNNIRQAGQPIEISRDFYQVMRTAQTIYALSGGAWDGTVNPLVDLWGFGRAGRRRDLPPRKEIEALLPAIGFDKILILPNRTLVKKNKATTLDLASIAKGYGVDQIAAVIQGAGFANYLVEIGGEIYAAGNRTDGKLWRVGINRPRKDAGIADVYKIVDLNNQAFATSGDYRNFFEVDGIRYSHIIDPRTGTPVSNGVVSVSIVADNCTIADGLATALMIMGPDDGLRLINRIGAADALIVTESPNGSLVDFYSDGFPLVKK